MPPASIGYRFDRFEIDLDARRLTREGRPVEIQDQPFELLVVLVENAGRLVSRETIVRRLWPPDTVVDFARGLNTAVRKVRRALGDTARTPVFIETTPRRGYRFLADVETVHAPASDPVAGAGAARTVSARLAAFFERRPALSVVLSGMVATTFLFLGTLLPSPLEGEAAGQCPGARAPVRAESCPLSRADEGVDAKAQAADRSRGPRAVPCALTP